MTPAGLAIAGEIRRDGPIPFSRFMEIALYHPEHGYYRRARDPFGKGGDFYTAEQLQPVFGILMASRIRQLWREMGEPADFTVVELGAGRREMADAFREWRYIGIDVDGGELPERFAGVVFSNEFFDALPVEVAVYRDGAFHRQRVTLAGEGFEWATGEEVPAAERDYYLSHYPPPEEGHWYEANLQALDWLRRIAKTLEAGYVLSIDYGYTCPEAVRFPQGTLMGYRSHTAHEDVLAAPGERDITAHVNFTALEQAGAACGLSRVSFESLSRTLLDAGEADEFASALQGEDERACERRRMQLKSLIFGMGETFRTLLQRK